MNKEVFVYRAQGIPEAKMLVDALRENGIDAYYKNNSPMQIMEHIGGDISQEQLIAVNESDLEKAQEILASFNKEVDDAEEIGDSYNANDLAQTEYEEDSAARNKRIHKAIAEVCAGILVAIAAIAWVIMTR